jgi:glycosyltransferase involved in cell wall biosynthesis
VALPSELLIVLDDGFVRSGEGTYTAGPMGYEFWAEAREVFGRVTVVSPVIASGSGSNGFARVDGPGVECGRQARPRLGCLRPAGLAELARLEKRADAVLMHTPGLQASLVYPLLRARRKRFGVVFRGEQVMLPEYWRSRGLPAGSLFAPMFRSLATRHLRDARVAIFVSESLRRRYGNGFDDKAVVVSDARIGPEWFLPARQFAQAPRPLRMVSVGNFDRAKDHATLLAACARLRGMGVDSWRLHLVGTGRLKDDLRRQAAELYINDRVAFHGHVPHGPALLSLVSSVDLFVLSSLTEGMPRALLEAAAAGLPIVATEVGGIPEVIGPALTVPSCQPGLLAEKIAELARSPERLSQAATACRAAAESFRPDYLKARYLEALRCLAA